MLRLGRFARSARNLLPALRPPHATRSFGIGFSKLPRNEEQIRQWEFREERKRHMADVNAKVARVCHGKPEPDTRSGCRVMLTEALGREPQQFEFEAVWYGILGRIAPARLQQELRERRVAVMDAADAVLADLRAQAATGKRTIITRVDVVSLLAAKLGDLPSADEVQVLWEQRGKALGVEWEENAAYLAKDREGRGDGRVTL